MNTKLSLVLTIVFGLFLAALLSRNAALVWMALPFLFYLGAGLLAAPTDARLRAVRVVDPLRCPAGTAATMTIQVTNDGPPVPRLRIDEQVLPNLSIIDWCAHQPAALPVGKSAGLHYTFSARRGQYRWEQIRVTLGDPFGLFDQSLSLPAAAQLRVVPDMPLIKRLRLRPLHTLQAPGPNLSRLPGSGVDFLGVREYHSGDSLRGIHWRLSARHPHRLFSKEFEREELADIGLIVDGSAAGNLQSGTDELFEYTVQAAASLAREALRRGNRLSALILGERVIRVFPGTGKHQLMNVLDLLACCRPGENISLNALRYLPVRLFPGRSLIIIISPLRTSDVPAITRLRASGYQALLVSPDPVRFAHRDGHHPLAVRAARLERKAMLWRLREIGVRVIDWQVDQPLRNPTGVFQWGRL